MTTKNEHLEQQWQRYKKKRRRRKPSTSVGRKAQVSHARDRRARNANHPQLRAGRNVVHARDETWDELVKLTERSEDRAQMWEESKARRRLALTLKSSWHGRGGKEKSKESMIIRKCWKRIIHHEQYWHGREEEGRRARTIRKCGKKAKHDHG
jgi:hypothetical protein